VHGPAQCSEARRRLGRTACLIHALSVPRPSWAQPETRVTFPETRSQFLTLLPSPPSVAEASLLRASRARPSSANLPECQTASGRRAGPRCASNPRHGNRRTPQAAPPRPKARSPNPVAGASLLRSSLRPSSANPAECQTALGRRAGPRCASNPRHGTRRTPQAAQPRLKTRSPNPVAGASLLRARPTIPEQGCSGYERAKAADEVGRGGLGLRAPGLRKWSPGRAIRLPCSA